VRQDEAADSTVMVHHLGIANLFAACEQLQIRRVIHFSAIGVDRKTPSAFSRTKLAGDKALIERDLDWVILRPSVVLGRPAFGASALMRGLAALPVVPVMPNTGELQIVLLEDVVRAVEYFLRPDSPARRIVELVGPDRYSFNKIISRIRRWYRWPPAREIHLPDFAASAMYKLGDIVSLLGWRPPVRTNAQLEIAPGGHRRCRKHGAAWAQSPEPCSILRARTGFGAGAVVCPHVFRQATSVCYLIAVLDFHRSCLARARLGLWNRPLA